MSRCAQKTITCLTAAQNQIRVRGDRDIEVGKGLVKVDGIFVAGSRTAIAALFRGADSLGEQSKIRAHMQVRMEHHAEEMIPVWILGAATEQIGIIKLTP